MVMLGCSDWYLSNSPASLYPKVPKRLTVRVVLPPEPEASSPSLLPQALTPRATQIVAAATAVAGRRRCIRCSFWPEGRSSLNVAPLVRAAGAARCARWCWWAGVACSVRALSRMVRALSRWIEILMDARCRCQGVAHNKFVTARASALFRRAASARRPAVGCGRKRGDHPIDPAPIAARGNGLACGGRCGTGCGQRVVIAASSPHPSPHGGALGRRDGGTAVSRSRGPPARSAA